MLNAFPLRGNLAELRVEVVSVEGTGAAAPTKLYGPGVTVSRTSEGLYKFTWADNPGTFVGMLWSLGASTPSAVAGHTVTWDDFSVSTKSIECLFSEQDFTVFDLADNEYATLAFLFKTSGSGV